MRSKTTKQVEVMAFEKLSTWSILFGVSRELYKRFKTEIWAFGFFAEMALIVWHRI